MKRVLLIIGVIALFNLTAKAYQMYAVNETTRLGKVGESFIYTTKVTTPEGTYRVFVSEYWKGGGVAAVRIK